MPAPSDIPEISEATDCAAEIFELYGPVAGALAMLYHHCRSLGLPERPSEYYVCKVIDMVAGQVDEAAG